MEQPQIVGIGEILWDLLPGGKCLGGAPANFAYHAGQLGARGTVVSSVGRDDLGGEVAEALRARGLATEYLRRDEAHPTGTVRVTADERGQPAYVIDTDVAWDFLPFDDAMEALAGQADAVCFGSLAQRAEGSRAAIRAFLGATRRDCLRIFDINLRQGFYEASTIEAALGVSDVLKLNDEELPVVAGLLDLPKADAPAVRRLLERFSLRLVALTRGKNGSVLYTKHRVSENPGCPAEVVADTVGAGDAFTAALALGLLRFEDLDRVHERASRLASFVCSQPGATPRIPPAFLETLR